nr:hypothetical protein [Pseudotabrizicola sediminis]
MTPFSTIAVTFAPGATVASFCFISVSATYMSVIFPTEMALFVSWTTLSMVDRFPNAKDASATSAKTIMNIGSQSTNETVVVPDWSKQNLCRRILIIDDWKIRDM